MIGIIASPRNQVQQFIGKKEIKIVNEMCISFRVVNGVKRLFVGQRVIYLEREIIFIGNGFLIKEKVASEVANIMMMGG